MISVYPDQEEFITEIRKVWKKHLRICGMAVTGAGKTRIAAKICEAMASRGLRVCFLVPRISLIAQTVKAFNDLGLTDICVIHGKGPIDENALITIGSLDTYIRRPKQSFDLVINDEVHINKEKMRQWMRDYPEERYLGLTATPCSNWLGDYYSVLVKGKSMRWMIDNGRLADFEIYAPHIPDLSKARLRMDNEVGEKEYVKADIDIVMGDAKVCDNIVKFWLENADNALTMGLCVNKAHANKLCRDFLRAGVQTEVITAEVPIDERERIFNRMREGITRIILSVNCLTEGFDMPECKTLIHAAPVNSVARWLQGTGRVLRYYKGQKARIFDHSGTALRLGFPDEIQINELQSGGKTGKKVKRKEVEKKVKEEQRCSKCTHLKPAGVHICPVCGHKPVFCEDVESDPTLQLKKVERKKGDKKTEATKEEKQRFYSELLGWQQASQWTGKPVSDGYLANTYREKFGVWPRGLERVNRSPSPSTLNFIKAKKIAFMHSKNKVKK